MIRIFLFCSRSVTYCQGGKQKLFAVRNSHMNISCLISYISHPVNVLCFAFCVFVFHQLMMKHWWHTLLPARPHDFKSEWLHRQDAVKIIRAAGESRKVSSALWWTNTDDTPTTAQFTQACFRSFPRSVTQNISIEI